jgi:type III pantothenate kinase
MPAIYRCKVASRMLLLDIGNSRIKWALARNGVLLQRGMADTADLNDLRNNFSKLPPPHRILASNVAGPSVEQQIRQMCAAWDCPIEFIVARFEQCGVKNSYVQPAQLGSDRWTALIAAWQYVQAACLVVNCGTATTIDALSNAGEFLGGLILPGIDMMQRGLIDGTAQLQTLSGNWCEFPRSTADAVFTGAIQATVGAIRQQHELLGIPGAPCVLGGGAANEIQGHMMLPLLRMDDMVLRGLQLAGLDSET